MKATVNEQRTVASRNTTEPCSKYERKQMNHQFNVRLDSKTLQYIYSLAEELQISQADVVKMAVRLFAKSEAKRRIPVIENSKK